MLKVFLKIKEQYLKTAMQYTFNFWMMVIAGVVMRALMMAAAYVIFRNVPTIVGWSEGEVYLIMSFMFLTEGFCNLFFDGIWDLPHLIFSGEFDVMLIRPVSPFFQILTYGFGLQGIGVVAFGLFSLLMALQTLNWINPLSILLCIIFLICGTAIRLSTYIISGTFLFFVDAKFNVMYSIYSFGENAKYPLSVYPLWMKVILLVLIPFGFIGYVPTLILRGENSLLLALALLAFAVLYFLFARFLFHKGVTKYESAGM